MIDLLLDCGLLQFGRFEENGDFKPFLLNFHMLPAYPDVLQRIAAALAKQAKNGHFERILCTPDSVPLGVAVSLQTGIPLVYSRGQGESPSHDLVGAYDVGHPALLLTNVLDNVGKVESLLKNARSVGLEVQKIAGIMEINNLDGIDRYSLFELKTVIQALVERGFLPVEQGKTIEKHLNL